MTCPNHPPTAWGAALLLAAGAAAASPQGESWPPVVRETTEVHVINVEVYVTDGAGRPVAGLAREDFELLDGGVPVPISNFYAVEGGRVTSPSGPSSAEGAAPDATAAGRRLHLLVFVDDANLRPAHRGATLRRLRDFLLENRRAETRTMLVTSGRPGSGSGLVVRQGLTDVPHEIFVALEELERQPTGGGHLDAERREIERAIGQLNVDAGAGFVDPGGAAGDPSANDGLRRQVAHEAGVILAQIRAHAQQRHDHLRRSLAVLRSFVDSASGLPEPKAVVYVSDGLPLRPGEDLLESFSRRVDPMGSVAAELSAQLESGRFDATREVLELLEHANASRVTFYALDASPAASGGRSAASAAGFRGASPAGVDERGRHETLTLLAERTGGRAGFGAAVLETALAGVLGDFDNHYSLGYAAPPLAAGEQRRLEVRVRRPELRVRHRGGWRERGVEEQLEQRVLAALWNELADNPLELTLETPRPQPRDDGNFTVPLVAKVPLGKLVLLPGAKEHRAKVSLYVAVRDERGRVSEVARHLCPVLIPNSEMLIALGRSVGCGVRLAMRPGRQTVAVLVRDDTAAVDSVLQAVFDIGGDAPESAPREAGE